MSWRILSKKRFEQFGSYGASPLSVCFVPFKKLGIYPCFSRFKIHGLSHAIYARGPQLTLLNDPMASSAIRGESVQAVVSRFAGA